MGKAFYGSQVTTSDTKDNIVFQIVIMELEITQGVEHGHSTAQKCFIFNKKTGEFEEANLNEKEE